MCTNWSPATHAAINTVPVQTFFNVLRCKTSRAQFQTYFQTLFLHLCDIHHVSPTVRSLDKCCLTVADSDAGAGWWHHRLTSEVVPGVGRQAGVFILFAVVPGGRALPGTLWLHFDHQGNPLLLVSCKHGGATRLEKKEAWMALIMKSLIQLWILKGVCRNQILDETVLLF